MCTLGVACTYLCPDSVLAVHLWQVVCFGCSSTVIVQTYEADGLCCKVTSKVPPEGITGDHAEPLWESVELVVVWPWSLKVVHGHTCPDAVSPVVVMRKAGSQR